MTEGYDERSCSLLQGLLQPNGIHRAFAAEVVVQPDEGDVAVPQRNVQIGADGPDPGREVVTPHVGFVISAHGQHFDPRIAERLYEPQPLIKLRLHAICLLSLAALHQIAREQDHLDLLFQQFVNDLLHEVRLRDVRVPDDGKTPRL